MNNLVVVTIVIIVLIIILGTMGYFVFRRGTKIDDTNVLFDIKPSQTPSISASCPACPDCKCPECPACNCPVNDQKLKSATEELNYLKWMVKFLGAIAKRENAINRAVLKECPTTFSMVPMIQSADQEFRLIKKDIGNDHDMLNYFNVHFTKLSGIPSTSYEEIL